MNRRLIVTAPVAVSMVLLASAAVSGEDRTIDGSGNNLVNPEWGSTFEQLLRAAPPAYADGVDAPAGADRPNPRDISNACAVQPESVPSDVGLSDLATFWGQILDHDMSLSSIMEPMEPLPIPVPMGDPWFDPDGTGDVWIPLARSEYDPSTGTGAGNPRQQVNRLTAYLDASFVYGSDEVRATALRRMDGSGKLRTSAGDLLPYNTFGLPNANDVGLPEETLFIAGDVRCNENAPLTVMHVLWVREHNRLCDELAKTHPDWSGEEIYQRARKLVGAAVQAITYEEWLPAVLGPGAMPPYIGYDPTVNPGISNEFAHAFFRFGHTMVNHTLLRFGPDGNPMPDGHLPLMHAFFDPSIVEQTGGDIGPWFRGLAFQLGQNIDAHVVTGLRNFLFSPGAGGLDLTAINMQRAREHGLPDLNTIRLAYGLPAYAEFSEITTDPEAVLGLTQMYSSPDQIDPWLGGIIEDHLAGAAVGETIWTAFRDQFTRLRDGDRFYYENDPAFTPVEVATIKATRLADVIRRNTSAKDVPDHVFFAEEKAAPVFADVNADGWVDVFDLLEMLARWGEVQASPESAACDLDGNGVVNVFDLLELLDNWGVAI